MAGFDLNLFIKTAQNIREKALKENRIDLSNTPEQIRILTEKEEGVIKTKYGNLVAESEPTSRAAKHTKNSVDDEFGQEEIDLLNKCEQILGKEKLISIDRVVGDPDSGVYARLTLPERFAHIAYGGGNIFALPKVKVDKPNYEIIMFVDEKFEENRNKPLPQKDITIRLAMLPDGRVVKVVRNSMYIGEFKKGVFASENWNAKTRKGGIFLHAGCREDYLQNVDGDYQTVRTLLIALSANGKTSTTCKILARKGEEKSWLVQDDGGTLMPSGSFHGFEAGGIFVKTESLNPGDQLETYYGLLKPDTLCENIFVKPDGDFDFFNVEKTSNGRAVILRRDFMHASSCIDVDHVDNIVLITRGQIIPAISKVSHAQAAALMVLGQSMESSAGDPTQAGKIRNEFFYDPFIAGSRTDHANLFYEILRGLPHINCYLLNTGGIGEGQHYHDISLRHTMNILDSLIRGGLESHWIDSITGFQVPKAVREVDSIYMHPEKLYSHQEFEERQNALNKIRRETIGKYADGLHPDIKNVFGC